ncbi:MAG: hypothetical protein ABW196_03515 [Solirubrobacterales bacterium]
MPSPFFECNDIQFHTVASQPEAFIAELTPADQAKLAVACEAIANAYAENTPQVRSRLVRGAKLHDLFAIFVDWPGSARATVLLARRDGNRVLVARGLETDDGRIARRDVERAERALVEARGNDGRKGDRG